MLIYISKYIYVSYSDLSMRDSSLNLDIKSGREELDLKNEQLEYGLIFWLHPTM